MASYLLADNAPLGGVAGSPREWVLIPAYSERPWKSPEKGAHPLRRDERAPLVDGRVRRRRAGLVARGRVGAFEEARGVVLAPARRELDHRAIA